LIEKAEYGFARENRLVKKNNFDLVFKKGVKKHTPFFMLIQSKNNLNIARLGISVAKRYVPKAIERNKIKRVVREQFRLHKKLLLGIDIIFIAHAKSRQTNASLLSDHFVKELKNIFNKKSCYG
jgi:ribonuclease P protein component